MSEAIQLKVKSVTGRVRYYPVGRLGEFVKQLTRKKTLSELEVEALRGLGCRIELLKD